MEARLEDHEVVAVDEVDEAVFLVDPARPGAGQRAGADERSVSAWIRRAVEHELSKPA